MSDHTHMNPVSTVGELIAELNRLVIIDKLQTDSPILSWSEFINFDQNLSMYYPFVIQDGKLFV